MTETKIDKDTIIKTIEKRQVISRELLEQKKAELERDITEVNRLLGILNQ